MGTAIMAMLRLIVAVALVATALSAPTWTKQLSMLSATTGAPLSDAHTTTTKASCHCEGCVHPFWSSGTCELPSCGSMPDITAEQCKQKCEQNEAQGSNGNGTYSRKDCKFSLHDAKQPVNNWKEFRVGASTSTSKTVTMHDLASYRCPNTINKNNWNMVDAAGNNLQGHDSDQVFNVNVNGNDMTVSSNSAWANMDLRFECPHVSDHTVSGQTAGYCWLYDHMPTSHETTTSGVHDQYTCYSNTRETHAPTPPTPTPTPVPTPSPTPSPTQTPTPAPSPTPTEHPTTRPPSPSPSHTPTETPTPAPSPTPTLSPTLSPTQTQWTIIAHQNIANGLFSAADRSDHTAGSSPSDDVYMALPSDYTNYRNSAGLCTFRLTYRGTSTGGGTAWDTLTASNTALRTATWTQSNWITSSTPGTFSCLDSGCTAWTREGYNAAYWRHGDRTDGCTAFEGVCVSSSSAAVFDGTHLSGCWWNCVGCTSRHDGAIPAAMGQIADEMTFEILSS